MTPEHHDPDETTTPLSRNGIRQRVHVGDTRPLCDYGLYRTEESAEQNGRGSRTGAKTGQITPTPARSARNERSFAWTALPEHSTAAANAR